MCSRLVFYCISFTLIILVSTTDPAGLDGLWNNDESSPFSDQQPSLWDDDESALSSNTDFLTSNDIASLSLFPSSEEDLNPDPSEQLFASEDANDDDDSPPIISSPFSNDPLLDDSSQQAQTAACSTPSFESPPTFFKRSRARRRGDPPSLFCPNPAPNSLAIVRKWPKLPGLEELETKPDAQALKAEALADPNFHGLCMLYSLGLLPYGICSSSLDPADLKLSGEKLLPIWLYGPFLLYDVSHGSLGTYSLFVFYLAYENSQFTQKIKRI